MDKYTLKFKSPAMEELYRQIRLPEVLLQFKLLYFLLTVINIITLIYGLA